MFHGISMKRAQRESMLSASKDIYTETARKDAAHFDPLPLSPEDPSRPIALVNLYQIRRAAALGHRTARGTELGKY